jgi:iron complex outermembrane receptor protein
LYFFNEGGIIHDFVTFPAGLLQIDGNNTLDTTTYAAFAHVDYKITDKLGFSAGGRYSIEDKSFEGFQTDQNAFTYKITGCYPVTDACRIALGFPDPNNPLRYFPAGVNHQTFHNFSPTVGLQYHFTPSVMAYASYSSGFKSGGWTTRLSSPIPDAKLAAFGPEHAKTGEFGVKSTWFDRRLQLNAAAFLTHYDGIQLNVQEGISPTTQNAGNAVIKGFELEGQAFLGGGLSISGTAGYQDAYYTKTLVGTLSPTEALPLDTPLPKTPKFKFSISPQYEYVLPNQAKIRLIADFTHTSKLSNDITNTLLLRRPSTDMLNMSIQYVAPGDKYQLIFGGTNITNDRYLTTGQAQLAGGQIYGTYNPPVQWYASLRMKF